jgi:hypothetical protein
MGSLLGPLLTLLDFELWKHAGTPDNFGANREPVDGREAPDAPVPPRQYIVDMGVVDWMNWIPIPADIERTIQRALLMRGMSFYATAAIYNFVERLVQQCRLLAPYWLARLLT